jgi:hypothetical protein
MFVKEKSTYSFSWGSDEVGEIGNEDDDDR